MNRSGELIPKRRSLAYSFLSLVCILTTDARIWRAPTAGYVQSGQTGGANFCFVQGHEARTHPKSEIRSCHAFFPTSALSSGALRMTADREAIRLICQLLSELGKLTTKVGIAG